MKASDDRSDAWNAAVARAHATWPADWGPAASFVEHLNARVPACRSTGAGGSQTMAQGGSARAERIELRATVKKR
jgi:hypothetical protein